MSEGNDWPTENDRVGLEVVVAVTKEAKDPITVVGIDAFIDLQVQLLRVDIMEHLTHLLPLRPIPIVQRGHLAVW